MIVTIITIQAIAIAALCWSNIKTLRHLKKERLDSFEYEMKRAKVLDVLVRLSSPTKENV